MAQEQDIGVIGDLLGTASKTSVSVQELRYEDSAPIRIAI